MQTSIYGPIASGLLLQTRMQVHDSQHPRALQVSCSSNYKISTWIFFVLTHLYIVAGQI